MLTNEQLIEIFLNGESGDSSAAFEDLVKRHGPLVLGVCRQVLNHRQDAEDAFQATFLVLARKAGTIRDRQLVGCWLYEVANRIARRARARASRRRLRPEMRGVEASGAEPESDAAWNELRPVLHAEVNGLPAKYGVPLVLCYLEGETHVEVARLLHWPVGTVKGRLSRARDMLRARLSRRGLDLDQIGRHLQQ
jgi:RNA polymerase sigma factor (sigma-70 family)